MPRAPLGLLWGQQGRPLSGEACATPESDSIESSSGTVVLTHSLFSSLVVCRMVMVFLSLRTLPNASKCSSPAALGAPSHSLEAALGRCGERREAVADAASRRWDPPVELARLSRKLLPGGVVFSREISRGAAARCRWAGIVYERSYLYGWVRLQRPPPPHPNPRRRTPDVKPLCAATELRPLHFLFLVWISHNLAGAFDLPGQNDDQRLWHYGGCDAIAGRGRGGGDGDGAPAGLINKRPAAPSFVSQNTEKKIAALLRSFAATRSERIFCPESLTRVTCCWLPVVAGWSSFRSWKDIFNLLLVVSDRWFARFVLSSNNAWTGPPRLAQGGPALILQPFLHRPRGIQNDQLKVLLLAYGASLSICPPHHH